jgi:hypothetical protein
VRQQSIAVLPTPMMSTRSPIEVMCPKATDSSQSMPMWIWSESWRPGNLEVPCPWARRCRRRPRRNPSVEQGLQALDRRVVANVHAHVEDHADLFVEHLLGQAERRDVRAHQAAGLAELLEDRDFVAEGHEVVGHGQRRGAGADAGRPLAVLLRRGLGSSSLTSSLCDRRRRA